MAYVERKRYTVHFLKQRGEGPSIAARAGLQTARHKLRLKKIKQG